MSKVEGRIVLVLSELREANLEGVAQRSGIGVRSLVGYMLNLRKRGYVARVHGGLYVLTEKGKTFLGDLLSAREAASRILAEVPFEKGFHFYRGLGQYTGLTAISLEGFHEVLKALEIESLDFHLSRGDFESWVRSLGDDSLADGLSRIRMEGLRGEEALKALTKAVGDRIRELKEALR